MMQSYVAYGLNIQSALSLPELTPAKSLAKCDVTVKFGNVAPPSHQCLIVDNCYYAGQDEARFFWDIIGAFQVKSGAEITIDPTSGAEEQLLRLPLLGAILAILLHQRGLLVLHGSAIAFGDNAAVFVGIKGQGKSTLAAFLHARGHSLLTDDVVAVDADHIGNQNVIPGFPHLKLWPDAAASLMGDESKELPPLASGYDKRARRIDDGFATRPVRLKKIYVLDGGPVPQIVPLLPQQALTQVIAHSYAARFGKAMLHNQAASSHFSQCARLISNISVCWLQRPRSLEQMSEVAQLIEDDMS